MYYIPTSAIILNIIIGIGSIGAGIIGLKFDDLKFNRPEVLKVYNVTSLLGLAFWYLLLHFPGPYNLWRTLILLTLALLTGLGTAKLSEKYGPKALVIPRFLLGFIVSSLILLPVHWWALHHRVLVMCACIVGLIFSQIKVFTPSFILAILVLSGYSWLLVNGLFILNRFTIDKYYIVFSISSSIVVLVAFARLYYFWKEGSHLPIEGTGALIEEGESQPIRSGENQSYNTVNTDEEANIGN